MSSVARGAVAGERCRAHYHPLRSVSVPTTTFLSPPSQPLIRLRCSACRARSVALARHTLQLRIVRLPRRTILGARAVGLLRTHSTLAPRLATLCVPCSCGGSRTTHTTTHRGSLRTFSGTVLVCAGVSNSPATAPRCYRLVVARFFICFAAVFHLAFQASWRRRAAKHGGTPRPPCIPRYGVPRPVTRSPPRFARESGCALRARLCVALVAALGFPLPPRCFSLPRPTPPRRSRQRDPLHCTRHATNAPQRPCGGLHVGACVPALLVNVTTFLLFTRRAGFFVPIRETFLVFVAGCPALPLELLLIGYRR